MGGDKAGKGRGKPVDGFPDWASYTSPDGRTYYYNAKTGVSSWKMPTPSDAKEIPGAAEQIRGRGSGKGGFGKGSGKGGGRGGLEKIHELEDSRPRRDNVYIFLDLENLAFLADFQAPLVFTCQEQGIKFRTYCSPSHSQADRATHLSRSDEKEAVDVRMVCDVAVLVNAMGPYVEILVVTDDLFAKTLAAELAPNVTHATWDGRLASHWRARFKDAASVEDFFKGFDIQRQRRDRSPSVTSRARSRGESFGRVGGTRASWSRTATVVDMKPSRSAVSVSKKKKSGGALKWPVGQKPSQGKQVGTIDRWFEKGYGFIKPASGGPQVFVHISKVVIERTPGISRPQLHSLMRWDVEFELAQGAKGPEAHRVSGPKGKALPADA